MENEKAFAHMLSRYEQKLESLMEPEEYLEFVADLAKECFRIEVEGMADSEFKECILDNFDKIVGGTEA